MKELNSTPVQPWGRPITATGAMNKSYSQLDISVGKRQNFATSVAVHMPLLAGLIRSIARSDEMVDDIVQQTALKALMNAHQFRFESSLKTWLTSIAVNEIRQAYRSRWHKYSVPLTNEIIEADLFQHGDPPHHTFEATQRVVEVRKAVSRLPQIYRGVVELCDLQGLPLKKVAQMLGLTMSAVKSRRHRARQKLKPLLAKLNTATCERSISQTEKGDVPLQTFMHPVFHGSLAEQCRA